MTAERALQRLRAGYLAGGKIKEPRWREKNRVLRQQGRRCRRVAVGRCVVGREFEAEERSNVDRPSSRVVLLPRVCPTNSVRSFGADGRSMAWTGQRQQARQQTKCLIETWARADGQTDGYLFLFAQAPMPALAQLVRERTPAWQRRIGSLARRAFPPRFKLALPHAALRKP